MTCEITVRVARAIFAADTEYCHRDWKQLTRPETDHFLTMAEAAVKEIKKPIPSFYGVQLS